MIITAALSPEPLDTAAHLDAVASPQAGATALFLGTVRDNDPEAAGTVVCLEYSAHPDAAAVLQRLASSAEAEALREDPQARQEDVRIAVSHRTGTLAVGEAAIIAAVSTRHRAEAFRIARDLVERVKAELPVWKRQVQQDGTAQWVGLGSLTAPDGLSA